MHLKDKQLESKLNKLYKGFANVQLKGDEIWIYQRDETYVLDTNCLDEYSLSYNPNVETIFITVSEDCRNEKESIRGLTKIKNRYYLNVPTTSFNKRELRRVLKIVELLNNIICKNKCSK